MSVVWKATTQTVSNSSVTETYSQKQVTHMTTQKKRGRPRKDVTSSVDAANKGVLKPQVTKTPLSVKKLERSERVSDGSTASYYELPKGAKELQDLISHKDMNTQIGEIFRSCYRYGQASHSDQLRDAKKIRFYINAEIKRLGS
jgi:hypothetical protein